MLKRLFILLIVLFSCQKIPHAPVNDNPLDPQNQLNNGDPFGLQASFSGNAVVLKWNRVNHEGILGYNVYRAVDDVNMLTMTDSVSMQDTSWVDSTIENGHRYFYQLTAEDVNRKESSMSHIAPVIVDTDPVIIINNGQRFTQERSVALTILAPMASEMWISGNKNFLDGGWEPYRATRTWVLSKNEGIQKVYVIVRNEQPYVSSVFADSIILDMTAPNAGFEVLPDSGRIGEPFVFNASHCSDNFSPINEILTRWDWENDGTYDTEWSADKKTTHIFKKEGPITAKLLIRDEAGWLDSTTQVIFVEMPPMIYIPAGEFIMGSRSNVGDLDEHPEHTVYLDAYWIDTYEVTNAEFSQFLNDGNENCFHYEMNIVDNGNAAFVPVEGYESHPVNFVSYSDALAYARWIGKSLPTEAQWEKAAGNGNSWIYPWGELLETNLANYWNSGDPFDMNPIGTTPVGFYNGENHGGYQTKNGASLSGVFDFAGNVREWCIDWYSKDYYSVSSGMNPTGPANGTFRVMRGGSWIDGEYFLRTVCRLYMLPDVISASVGFRCVKIDD